MSTKGGLGIGAVMMLVAGCGVPEGLYDEGDVGVRQSAQCRVNCGDGDLNGRGIFNVEGGNISIPTLTGPLFPLAFVSNYKGVFLRGIQNGVAGDYPLGASYGGNAVFLTGISAPTTAVGVHYQWNNVNYVSSGASLVSMVFYFAVNGEAFELAFLQGREVPSLVNGVSEYSFRFRNIGGLWKSVCTDDGGVVTTAGFLGGVGFDPQTGARSNSSELTTIACRKGGIVTCMEWGYKPWQSALNTNNNNVESLVTAHSSCIQMKRAAYCGDDSFTANGTAFGIEDVYNIKSTPQSFLEAMWTPSGASCLNPTHRRRPDIALVGCPAVLPLCPSASVPSWNLGRLASETN